MTSAFTHFRGHYHSLLKERLTILVTKSQKEYILQHGGGEYIRGLVEEDEKRREDAEV